MRFLDRTFNERMDAVDALYDKVRAAFDDVLEGFTFERGSDCVIVLTECECVDEMPTRYRIGFEDDDAGYNLSLFLPVPGFGPGLWHLLGESDSSLEPFRNRIVDAAKFDELEAMIDAELNTSGAHYHFQKTLVGVDVMMDDYSFLVSQKAEDQFEVQQYLWSNSQGLYTAYVGTGTLSQVVEWMLELLK